MPSNEVVLKALSNIDGVIEIARHEQLRQGRYIFNEVNEKLKNEGAICGGHQACLVGSLWISHGVKSTASEFWGSTELELPGVGDRINFMRNRPALRLSYNYINDAALRYIKKNFAKWYERYENEVEIDYREAVDDNDSGWGETLFEEVLMGKSKRVVRDHVIKVCNNAKRALRRDYPEAFVYNIADRELVAA